MGVATVAVLFTDLVDSTATAERLGPISAHEHRREHFDRLRAAVQTFGGAEVKTTGDGLMVVFRSPSDASRCASEMQAVTERKGAGAEGPTRIRVGIAFGEASEEDGDWFGMPVVRAARLCAEAQAGQILTDQFVAALADHADTEFKSLGERALKGITDPVLTLELVRARPVAPIPLPRSLELPAGGVFVGRTSQLTELDQAWSVARRAGTAQLVLVAGEPGAGKTSLVATMARRVHAEDGAVALFGRCDDGAGLPYQPFAQALAHYVRFADARMLEEHVTTFGGDLARVVPDLPTRVPSAPPPIVGDPASERWRLFRSVQGLIHAACEANPLVIVVDDLHWATAPTLQMLADLLTTDRTAPLLVVATYRDTELARTHPLADALADLRRQQGVTRVRLEGLDEHETEDLMVTMAGHDLTDEGLDLARVLHARTEGNPFFAIEVLRHLAEAGAITYQDGRWRATALAAESLPEGVKEVVGRRLRRLPDRTNDALSIAAIVGLEFDVAIIAQVGSWSVPEALDAFDGASRAGLVRETGLPNRFLFTHALVRDTLRDELGPSRRVHLHGQVANAIEVVHASDLDRWLPDLAMHHVEAAYPGRVGPAVEFALRAAEQARLGAAISQAVAILERALAVARLDSNANPEVVVSLLVALAQTTALHDAAIARAYADEASRLAIDAELWTWLGRGCASMWSATTTSTAGGVAGDRWLLDLCELALQHPSDLDATVHAVVMAMTVGLRMWAGEDPQFERAAEAIALASQTDDELAICLAANAELGCGMQQGLSREATLEVLRTAERITKRDRHVHFMAAGPRCTASALLGDAARFAAASSQVDDAARVLGSSRAKAWSAWWRAMAAIRRGSWDEGLALTREGTTATQDPIGEVMLGANTMLIAAHRGQAEQARSVLPTGPALAGLGAATLGFTALIHALAGDGRAASDALAPIVRDRMFDRDATGMLVLGTAAWGAAAADEPALSRPVEDKLRRFRGLMAYGGIMEFGSVDGLLARIVFNAGRLDEADELFASGLSLEDSYSASVLASYTRLWWARCLMARDKSGDAGRSATLLDEAVATADRLGMAHVAAEARELAAR